MEVMNDFEFQVFPIGSHQKENIHQLSQDKTNHFTFLVANIM